MYEASGRISRYRFAFAGPVRALLAVLGATRRRARIDVSVDRVEIRFGLGFAAGFPRSSIADVERVANVRISRGVHGLDGHWLVNGSGVNLVRFTLTPSTRGRVLGFPVKLSVLDVSVEDPEALLADIRHGGQQRPSG